VGALIFPEGVAVAGVGVNLAEAMYATTTATITSGMTARPSDDSSRETSKTEVSSTLSITTAVTLRVYSHVLREHAQDVGDVFAQAIKASVSKSVSSQGGES
jgi:hypothetical protein